MSKILYFAYGTNLYRPLFENRIMAEVDYTPRVGFISGYRLTGNFSGYPDITYGYTKRVHGVIYELTPEQERMMDRVEGYPEFYNRITVHVHSGKSLEECLAYSTYIGTQGRKTKREQKEYELPKEVQQLMIKGMIDSGIPTEAIKGEEALTILR